MVNVARLRWEASGALTCLAVEGRFLEAADTAGLRTEAARALQQGAAAVFLSEGELGDPIVLAAGLSSWVPRLLLGVRTHLSPAGRHPALLARDMASLDLVCGGRSVLCFAPPFLASLPEAVSLCRALWRAGDLVSDGPYFPVRAAANRARPAGERSPRIAFDCTAGDELPSFLVGAADLLLWPLAEDPADCRLECV